MKFGCTARNSELKSEATDLALQFGLVTPYTAYLIMQDESGRHVAVENQVMKDFGMDLRAKVSAGEAYDKFQHQADGSTGVSVARMQNALKSSTSVMGFPEPRKR